MNYLVSNHKFLEKETPYKGVPCGISASQGQKLNSNLDYINGNNKKKVNLILGAANYKVGNSIDELK